MGSRQHQVAFFLVFFAPRGRLEPEGKRKKMALNLKTEDDGEDNDSQSENSKEEQMEAEKDIGRLIVNTWKIDVFYSWFTDFAESFSANSSKTT